MSNMDWMDDKDEKEEEQTIWDSCMYCNKQYKSIPRHLKNCPNNPANKITKRIVTVSTVLDEIVKSMTSEDLTNPDEIQLRKILTAARGHKNRNETYQRRQIVRPLIEYLIKQNWINLD